MTARLLKKHLLSLLLAPALIFSAATIITGCGGEEEAPPVENPVAVPVEQPVEPPPPAKPAGPPMAETVPTTLPALAFMPAEAQIAIALPALPGLRDNILPLVKALSEPDRDIDAELKKAVSDAAGEIGVQADTYEALATALGVDPAAPVAAFVDFSKTIATAVAAKAKFDVAEKERMEKEAAEKATAAPSDPGTEPTGSEPSEEEAADEPSAQPDYFAEADAPMWVVVLGVTDPEKARTELERIVAADDGLSAMPSGTEDVDGVTITTRDKWGYFTTDKQLLFGNLELLRGAVKRVKDPATFRYGTIECPPKVADEAVALIYGGRFMPLLETALPLMGVEDEALPQLQTQIETYKAMFSSDSDDPALVTASIAGGQFEVNTRIDSATHAGLLDETGQPTPLRLARYLPENTLALISLRLSDEMKKQFKDQIMPAVSASGDPDAAAQAGKATQVVDQLGDEVTLGVTGAQAGLPTVYVMLGLAQPEATRGLQELFFPMPENVAYEGFNIGKYPVFPGLEVNLSFVDNILLASTSEDSVKAVIDLHKAQKSSALFSSMEPPLDIEKPVYQTIVLNTALIEQGMGVASMLPIAGASDANPGLMRVINAIREVRAIGSLEGTWLTSNLTIYLKDLEAAIAASKAAAAAASTADATEAPAEGAAPESK